MHFEDKARGLLITPFFMQEFKYSTIDDILGPLKFLSTAPTFACDINDFERLIVYADGEGHYELKNLRRLLEANGVYVNDRRFTYTRVVVQIVNRLSGIPVDIDHQHCPWASSEYNISRGMDIFETWPMDNQPNCHALLKACHQCSGRRKGCNYAKAVVVPCGDCARRGRTCPYASGKRVCIGCHDKGLDCVAGPCEENERRQTAFRVAKEDVHVLCALHQFVLGTRCLRLGKKMLAASQIRALDGYLQREPVRNIDMEAKIFMYSSAFQRVAIVDGQLLVDHQRDHESEDQSKLGEWWGFEVADESGHVEPHEFIAPHLGFPHPHDALVFIDHILASPGDVFYRDLCVFNKAFKPVSVRIMGIAGVAFAEKGLRIGGVEVQKKGSRVVYISLGWNKPYEQQ